MSEHPPRLEMRGISKSFGAVRAIRSAEISIQAGRVHALVGENGAGKSTMIKILSGVEHRGRWPGRAEVSARPRPPGLSTCTGPRCPS